MRAMADIFAPRSSPDFSFAFDNSDFSDRVLRIEIVPETPVTDSDSEDRTRTVDWALNRKRRRGEIKPDNVEDREEITNEELDGNQGEKPVGMIKEPSSNNGSNQSGDEVASRYNDLKFRTIHVSSAILAANSPFFYKESKQREVTIRIRASEEATLTEVLKFMYSRTLTGTSVQELLDVLNVADKYEVTSCLSYCCTMLLKLPMTFETALIFVNFPESDRVQPLVDAAMQFLVTRYKSKLMYDEEALRLPLAVIEAIFSRDDLRVGWEDCVFKAVHGWARAHYPDPEARRELIRTRLARLIRFPHMTCKALHLVAGCKDYDHDLVVEALFFKSDPEAKKTPRFAERAYGFRPVKVVAFKLPREKCIVYVDLKRDECVNLFPEHWVHSRLFSLAGHRLYLSGHCNTDPPGSDRFFFGFFLGMQKKVLALPFAVEYEFAAWSGISGGFEKKCSGKYTFGAIENVGSRNMLGMPWAEFVADDNPYFVDRVLHIRAEVTVGR